MKIEERIKRLTQLVNIKIPIFQGAMAHIADHKLACAVSEAGGLGTIASGGMCAGELYREIELFRENCDKPFAVNVALKDENVEELFRVLREMHVPVVVTGAGNPERYMEALKSDGITVIPVVASVALARRMQKCGADAVIVEGMESGGHIGNTTTMSLVPQIDDVIGIPIIAAGGIADERGIAAALMLGASAVQMGTRFIAAKECDAAPEYKEKILKAKDISTVVLNMTQIEKDNIRAIRNALTKKYLSMEYAGENVDAMLKDSLRVAAKEGNVESGLFMAGQISGLLEDEICIADYIGDIWKKTEILLKQ